MAKGVPPVRVDAVTVLASGASAILVIATFKVLALRFHQHPLAQAFNVLF
jgi:hypothetical protein